MSSLEKVKFGHGDGHKSLIYLVRHGESTGNASRILLDPMTIHLTENGQREAQLLGHSLSDVKFTRVYASNYPRAIETAQIALGQSKHSKDVLITIDERIRERGDSKFHGLPYETLAEFAGKGIDIGHPHFEYKDLHIDGMEHISDVLTRQEEFFDELFKDLNENKSQEVILIVTHGFFIQLLMKHLTITDKYGIKHLEPELTEKCIQNCGYLILELVKGENGMQNRLEFLKIHQTEHMKPSGLED